MAGEAISLEQKLRLVMLGKEPGVSISDLCAEMGVSRQTFYKWRRRYEAEGLEGLRERPRTPGHSPGQLSAAIEDEIVSVRKQLWAEGLDAGAGSILSRLGGGVGLDGPSAAGSSRLGDPPAGEASQVVVAPVRVAPAQRLVADRATEWRLKRGRKVEIIDILDDHSRLCVAFGVTEALTMEAAWDTLAEGMIEWGPPARLLSDGGLTFTGRRHQVTVEFEEWVAAHHIHQIVSSPRHPQTLGKIERFHQTLKRWLRAQPRADDLEELGQQLERFRDLYNHERDHQGIGRITPASRYQATPRAEPGSAFTEKPPATKAGYRQVNSNGAIAWGRYEIGISMEWAKQVACVIQTGDTIEVFNDYQLIRRLVLDPTRRYQPTGRPPGRPPKPKA